MGRAIFTITEICFLSQSLLKVEEHPAAFLKKEKAMDVRSKWIKQLLVTWVETHRFFGVPSSLVSIRAKSKINCPCKSQSLQYSTEALQPPSELHSVKDLAWNNKSKILQHLLWGHQRQWEPLCQHGHCVPAECQYICIPHVPHLSSRRSFFGFRSASSRPQCPQAFLYSSHVIMKLHDNQTCLLNFTFPHVAVCHFPALPLRGTLMGHAP